MSRKTHSSPEATREALLDAAETVFYEKGVSRAALQDIAEQAGVTRGALYWHFEGKADLVQSLLERVRMPFEELLEEAPAPLQGDSPLDEIRRACLQALKRMERPRYRCVHAILLHRCEFFADVNPIQMLAEMSREALASTLPRFQASEAADELRAGLSTETANRLLHNQLLGLLHDWHLNPDAFSLVETGSELINAWFDLVAK